MSEDGLIPNEVRDDVHRLYETRKLTDHHLKCRILQAVKDFISTNERKRSTSCHGGGGIHVYEN